MDPGTGSALVDKIRYLSATKFPETGFAASTIDLAVTSDGGKRIERVFISKNGDNFVAKRQDEPALYELTASAVTELQKAAADLKPAPPPGKKYFYNYSRQELSLLANLLSARHPAYIP